MSLYYIVLYPLSHYWRHFTIFANNPKEAINKINKFHRDLYKSILAKYPKDNYGKAERAKQIVRCCRRIKRKNKVTWPELKYDKKYKIMDITQTSVPYEGHLNIGEEMVVNLLPAIDLFWGKTKK